MSGYLPSTLDRWNVVDGAGWGWGRYATKQEAEDRRDNLRAMRDSALYPNDPTAQFDIAEVDS